MSGLPEDLVEQVSRALREDIGPGDLTARLVPAGQAMRATILCREPAVLCGTPWADAAFRQVDGRIAVRWRSQDGERVAADAVIAEIAGPARGVLTAERTALNFLQLLSGTATVTRQYVDAVAGTGCRILDTRKTLPGLRSAQKYAVRCGGGSNHRMGLYDMVLIKENHIAAAGTIPIAVAAARRAAPDVRVEIETENLDEMEQALDAGADVIMLDEFSLEDLRTAVARNRAHSRRAELECSGGVSLEQLHTLAATGVDCISIGGLTKHVRAIDLSMRFEPAG
ncbi:MAG: carboxylating nicotinate-nucleotide diphosphorylase [Gammaproteobacteria bacterium]|nr:carboxylating nicotinate-nucleotide diphosphorylase [Gammaproteobacteria bacterium]